MAGEPMTVVCKNCEKRYKIPTTFQAQKFTCKACGKPVFIRSRTTTQRKTTTVRRYTRAKGNLQAKKVSPVQIASGIVSLVIVLGIIAYFIVT